MSIERTVICDSCGGIIAARSTVAAARADARSVGARTNLPGGKDLCAACVAAGHEVT